MAGSANCVISVLLNTWKAIRQFAYTIIFNFIVFICPPTARNGKEATLAQMKTKHKSGQWTTMIMSNEGSKIINCRSSHDTKYNNNEHNIGAEWYVTVQCWPKPWPFQHAIIARIGSTLKRQANKHAKVIIMVIIIMQVASCVQLLCGVWYSCLSFVKHAFTGIAHRDWWLGELVKLFLIYHSRSRLIWCVCVCMRACRNCRWATGLISIDKYVIFNCTFSLHYSLPLSDCVNVVRRVCNKCCLWTVENHIVHTMHCEHVQTSYNLI